MEEHNIGAAIDPTIRFVFARVAVRVYFEQRVEGVATGLRWVDVVVGLLDQSAVYEESAEQILQIELAGS